MPASYTKPHLDFPAQVQLLASRGLVIPDPQYAQRLLRAVGYYRLSGYWYPYRQPDPSGGGRADDFLPGTSLDQIVGLYDFDRRLKLHLLDALERIEIAARVQVGAVLGRRGVYAHLDSANLVSPAYNSYDKYGILRYGENWSTQDGVGTVRRGA